LTFGSSFWASFLCFIKAVIKLDICAEPPHFIDHDPAETGSAYYTATARRGQSRGSNQLTFRRREQ